MYGYGDEVIIVDCKHGHRFEIGEMVTIVAVGYDDYQAENAYGEKWWVREEELSVEK